MKSINSDDAGNTLTRLLYAESALLVIQVGATEVVTPASVLYKTYWNVPVSSQGFSSDSNFVS